MVLRRAREELLLRRPTRAVDVRGELGATSGWFISIDDEYVFDLSPPGCVLLELKGAAPLDLSKSLELCALLSFVVDEVIVPEPRPGRFRSGRLSGQRKLVHSLNDTVDGGFAAYVSALANAAEAVSGLFAPRTRASLRSRVIPEAPNKWAFLSQPISVLTRRLLLVYWSGLLSIAGPSRLLNFWRVFEAALPRTTRDAVFAAFASTSIGPVWADERDPMRGTLRRVNVAARLTRNAKERFQDLTNKLGSVTAAQAHLYWTRRGKAAHADQSAVEFDQLGEFSEVLRDAELVRFLARYALERTWA